jgi:SLOG cluster2
MAAILPSDALSGIRIGISVSESPDLYRLGLTETHFRLALGEISRSVLVSGGSLAYGGYLSPEGYTTFLVQELQRYSRRDQPLLICLAWQEHRKLSLSEFRKRRKDLGLFGRIVCLDLSGKEIDPATDRGEDPVVVEDAGILRAGLTAMRRYMAMQTQGRVLMGGKRNGFQGEIPGLMEEVLLSIEAGQPVYLAGGFGGVTADIVEALGVDGNAWLTKRTDAPPDDPRWITGRERLRAVSSSATWKGLQNGLSDDENQRLAATHRPSDIAALVSMGLGRLGRR